MHMRTIIVDKHGIRLDKYLQSKFPTLSFNLLQRFLKENKIKVNSKKVPLNTVLNAGDELKLFILDEFLDVVEPSLDLKAIVYEDENILVVNKPSGLITIDEDPLLDTLDKRIKKYLNSFDGSCCHRLDRGTQGLVIYGKTSKACDTICEAIKQHKLHKHYVCVTVGWPQPNAGEIRNYLLKDDKGFVKAYSKQVEGSKEAVTKYKTIATKDELAYVDVEIFTGRTHQIRVTFKSISCPILGDSKYGIESVNRKFKKNRQCLCAYKIQMPTFEGDLKYLSNKIFEIEKPKFNLF